LGQQTEKIMKMTNIALRVGFSIVALATPALAAVTRQERPKAGMGRLRHVTPKLRSVMVGMYYNFDQTREFAYERCMHDRGFAQ
jgi:hypothetical protein